jgi:hypothetical protein
MMFCFQLVIQMVIQMKTRKIIYKVIYCNNTFSTLTFIFNVGSTTFYTPPPMFH